MTAPEPELAPVAIPELPTEAVPEAVTTPCPTWIPIIGRVKWFDATRGFGFVVSDAMDGDILVHFSVLREHGRRSLARRGAHRVHADEA